MTDKKPDSKTSIEVKKDIYGDFKDLMKGWESDSFDSLSMPAYSDKYTTYYPTQYNTIPSQPAIPTNYNWTVTPSWSQNIYTTNTYQVSPKVSKLDCKVEVTMDDGKVESITREDLIKYIYEQKLVRENEVVRKVYERYQVAVKLVRSDDDGDTGV